MSEAALHPPATRWSPLAVVLVVCAGLRCWLIVHTVSISNDGPIFIRMARAFFAGPAAVCRAYEYHVGYPAAVAAAHAGLARLGVVDAGPRSWDLAAQLASLAASLAATAALWRIAERTFGWRAALASALPFAASRKWSILGADVMSDALALALTLWSVAFAVSTLGRLRRADRWPSLVLAALAGTCAGAGYLVRPEALVGLPIAIAVWLVGQRRERLALRRVLTATCVATVAAIACAAPYAIAIGGLTKKKRLGDFAAAPPFDAPPLAAIDAPRAAVSALGQVVVEVGEAMHWALFILAAIWLLAWIASRASRRARDAVGALMPMPADSSYAASLLAAAALLTPVLIGLQVRAGYLDYRHALLLAALLVPAAGAAAGAGATVIAHAITRAMPIHGRLLCGIALAVTTGAIGANAMRPLHAGGMAARRAGEVIAPTVSPGDVTFTDSWLFLHYSGSAGTQFDGKLLGAAEALLYVRDAAPTVTIFAPTRSYLIAHPRLAATLRPPEFEPLVAIDDDPDAVAVYRVRHAVENVSGSSGASDR